MVLRCSNLPRYDGKLHQLLCDLSLTFCRIQLLFYILSTGRWTREEHLAFIKGLELYGKGWKKIACLIKTRTVVQIRTHAQKYFLKLSKARQNGENLINSAGRAGADAARKRRYIKCDRPLGICPALKQYFQKGRDSRGPSPTSSPSGSGSNDIATGTGASDGTINASNRTTLSGSGSFDGKPNLNIKEELLDAETGLFNFLSPVLHIDDSTSGSDDGRNSVNSGISNNSAPAAPVWYARGNHLKSLLEDAEGLDWTADRGVKHVESVANINKPNPIYSQQQVTEGALVTPNTAVAGVVGAKVKNAFHPWNLVDEHKTGVDASTNVKKIGIKLGAAGENVGEIVVPPSASASSPTKRVKVESSAEMQQQLTTVPPHSTTTYSMEVSQSNQMMNSRVGRTKRK